MVAFTTTLYGKARFVLYSRRHTTKADQRLRYHTFMERPTSTVTILTPSGRGAVATVSVRGPQAVEFVQQCFTAASGKRLADLPLRRIVFGRWQATAGPGEELVVSRLTDDSIEVHCHGGTAAVEAVVSSLESCGALRQSPHVWLDQTEPDLIAAEARAALAEAKTERTALILLDQYHGALRREIRTIIECMDRGDHSLGTQKLNRLCQLSSVGQHLTTPWRVAIAGPPNVGKSSLMNALLGYSRSIVFDQPGTTRDVIRAETAFDGWPVELIDTAGLRETSDAIESVGVKRAEQVMVNADLCLRVSDSPQLAGRRAETNEGYPVTELVVLNKIDLLPGPGSLLLWPGPKVSATTGQGLPELIQAVVQSLAPIAPAPGDAVPFTSAQRKLIADASHAVAAQRFHHARGCLEKIPLRERSSSVGRPAE
jgi:tRNA modification GTPase